MLWPSIEQVIISNAYIGAHDCDTWIHNVLESSSTQCHRPHRYYNHPFGHLTRGNILLL